jgi:hypothetical protein
MLPLHRIREPTAFLPLIASSPMHKQGLFGLPMVCPAAIPGHRPLRDKI